MNSPALAACEIKPLESALQAQACARLMAGSEPWLTLGRGYEDGLKLLSEPAKEVYVALAQGQVLGFVVLQLRGPLNGYLQSIGVQPQWRSRGIGRKLLEFAEERIFRQSPNVFLCVSSFNLQAQKLYRRLGYLQVGELKDYLVAGHAELLLRKSRGPISGYKPAP